MTVIVLTAVTPGLRGELTRWLLEISPGVFAGRVSRRVREHLWAYARDRCGDGCAVMLSTARHEQGFVIETAGRDRWVPVDMDGLTLMRR